MLYEEYLDDTCYEEEDCRLKSCGAKIAFAPGSALADVSYTDGPDGPISNIPWNQFAQAIDLLNFDISQDAAVEEYFVVGDCDPRQKVTSCSFNISGSMYLCKNDKAQCYLCRPKNCVAFCYSPCGDGLVYDVEDQDPDPTSLPDDISISDPIVRGAAVMFGVVVINSCSQSVSPPDYITVNFSGQGRGKLYRDNFCNVIEDGPNFPIPLSDGEKKIFDEVASNKAA